MLLPLAPFPARFRPTVLRSALVPLVTLSLLLGSCRGKGDEAADVHQPGPPATMMALVKSLVQRLNRLVRIV